MARLLVVCRRSESTFDREGNKTVNIVEQILETKQLCSSGCWEEWLKLSASGCIPPTGDPQGFQCQGHCKYEVLASKCVQTSLFSGAAFYQQMCGDDGGPVVVSAGRRLGGRRRSVAPTPPRR